jgi:hypothetical protein
MFGSYIHYFIPLFLQTFTFQIDLSIKENFTIKGESCQHVNRQPADLFSTTNRPYFHRLQTHLPPPADPISTGGNGVCRWWGHEGTVSENDRKGMD